MHAWNTELPAFFEEKELGASTSLLVDKPFGGEFFCPRGLERMTDREKTITLSFNKTFVQEAETRWCLFVKNNDE